MATCVISNLTSVFLISPKFMNKQVHNHIDFVAIIYLFIHSVFNNTKTMQRIGLFVLLCFVGVILAQPDLQRWKEMTLSVPRANAAAIGVKNYAIIAGGLTENGTASNVVDLLDVSTRNITQSTLSSARYNSLAISIGSYAIFAGGFDMNETSASPVNSVEVLDVDTMQWNSTQFPDSFYNSMVTAISTANLAVFFNGTGFAVYDPKAADGSAWITKDFTSTFKNQPGALGVLGNTIYVLQNDTQPRFAGFLLDSLTLTKLSVLPSGLRISGGFFGPALAINASLYYYSRDTLFIYNSQDGLWSISLFPQAASDLPTAVPLQGYIVMPQTDKQYLFDVQSSQWNSTNFIISANASAVAVVEDKYVVIAGGFDEDQVTAALNVLEYVPPVAPVTPVEPQAPTASTAVHSFVASIGLVIVSALISFF